MNIDRRAELVQVFRDASGITAEVIKEADEVKRQSSLLGRIGHTLWNGEVLDVREEISIEKGGLHRLKNLVAQESGVFFPRSPIFYTIDLVKEPGKIPEYVMGFMYDLDFAGECIGEKGEVAIKYNPREIWLRRGTEPIVEVVEGKLLLHLPENEGVVLLPERKSEGYDFNLGTHRIGFAPGILT